MLNQAPEIIKSVREDILNMSQHQFAEYLSRENAVEKANITQSTLSKYETGQYNIPTDVLLHCQNLRKEKYAKLEYSKQEMIEKLQIVDDKIHSQSLRAIGIILDQIT